MERKGADQSCSNVKADVGFESLDVSRQSKKSDIGNKSELGFKTRQCKYSQSDYYFILIGKKLKRINSWQLRLT